MGDIVGHEFHGNQHVAGGAHKAAKDAHNAIAKGDAPRGVRDMHKAAGHVHAIAEKAAKEGHLSPEHSKAAEAMTKAANDMSKEHQVAFKMPEAVPKAAVPEGAHAEHLAAFKEHNAQAIAKRGTDEGEQHKQAATAHLAAANAHKTPGNEDLANKESTRANAISKAITPDAPKSKDDALIQGHAKTLAAKGAKDREPERGTLGGNSPGHEFDTTENHHDSEKAISSSKAANASGKAIDHKDAADEHRAAAEKFGKDSILGAKHMRAADEHDEKAKSMTSLAPGFSASRGKDQASDTKPTPKGDGSATYGGAKSVKRDGNGEIPGHEFAKGGKHEATAKSDPDSKAAAEASEEANHPDNHEFAAELHESAAAAHREAAEAHGEGSDVARAHHDAAEAHEAKAKEMKGGGGSKKPGHEFAKNGDLHSHSLPALKTTEEANKSGEAADHRHAAASHRDAAEDHGLSSRLGGMHARAAEQHDDKADEIQHHVEHQDSLRDLRTGRPDSDDAGDQNHEYRTASSKAEKAEAKYKAMVPGGMDALSKEEHGTASRLAQSVAKNHRMAAAHASSPDENKRHNKIADEHDDIANEHKMHMRF